MSHTPGPWRWDENGYCWLVGSDSTTILHVDDSGNKCPSRDDPNARLIAAAPELLKALKALLAEHGCDDGCEVCELAIDARLKAEGRP